MKFTSLKVSRIIVVLMMVLIVGAAFYGLTNGTIFQHRAEGVSGVSDCDGACSDCEDVIATNRKTTEATSTVVNSEATSKTATATTSLRKLKTFEGAVVELNTSTGAVLALKTKDKVYALDVGPSWYLQYKNFSIKAGDLIKASGFEMRDNINQPLLVVADLSNAKSGVTVTVRDSNGSGAWKGSGQQECGGCGGEGGSCSDVQ